MVRSDPRKRRSGQTNGLYFVVKSGNGAPRDNQGTFCSNFQADARDPASCRRGLRDGGREQPTAAPPLSSGSRSAAAPTRRPAPPTPQRARVGVPAVASVAPVRLHVTCTDRGARRPPRARFRARPPATNKAGARSAAAPTRRPAPPTPPRARVGVPAGGCTARRARYGMVQGGTAPVSTRRQR